MNNQSSTQFEAVSLSKTDPTLTQEYLLDNYVLKNGQLHILKPVKVTTQSRYGHKSLSIKGVTYPYHRFLMLMLTGKISEHIDHADGNPSNNEITNLRLATNQQNKCNRRLNRNSKTGIKNVRQHPNGSYIVTIQVHKQKIYIGCFYDIELAELAAREARVKYHGEFARHE